MLKILTALFLLAGSAISQTSFTLPVTGPGGWLHAGVTDLVSISIPQQATVSRVDVSYNIMFDSKTWWENVIPQTPFPGFPRRALVRKQLWMDMHANSALISTSPRLQHNSNFTTPFGFDGIMDFGGLTGTQDNQLIPLVSTSSYFPGADSFADQFIGTGSTAVTANGHIFLNGYGLGAFVYQEFLQGSITITVWP